MWFVFLYKMEPEWYVEFRVFSSLTPDFTSVDSYGFLLLLIKDDIQHTLCCWFWATIDYEWHFCAPKNAMKLWPTIFFYFEKDSDFRNVKMGKIYIIDSLDHTLYPYRRATGGRLQSWSEVLEVPCYARNSLFL